MSDSKEQLDHLKKQARDLLNLARANDASALAKLALVSRERSDRGVSAARSLVRDLSRVRDPECARAALDASARARVVAMLEATPA